MAFNYDDEDDEDNDRMPVRMRTRMNICS